MRIILWLGGAAMIAAPFLINAPIGKGMIIFGLSVFTWQAYTLKAWNMVLANTIGIIGYAFSMWG